MARVNCCLIVDSGLQGEAFAPCVGCGITTCGLSCARTVDNAGVYVVLGA